MSDDDDITYTVCDGCRGTFGDGAYPWVLRQMHGTCDACKERAFHQARGHAFAGEPPRGLPAKQKHAKPSDLRDDLRRIDFLDGRGAYLYGLPGRGKSFQAAALVQRAWDVWAARRGVPPECRWWRTDIMLNFMRSLQGKDKYAEFYHDILTCHILVLDDFGAERVTEWARGELLLILSERYDQNRCTIVTSNFSLGELAQRISESADDPSGERIASRIAEVCVRVHIDGEDRRLNPSLNGGRNT